RPDGSLERVLTVFLAGAECPFACVFCDLWRYTVPHPTPPGALVRQLDLALRDAPRAERVKLYNAGNFFDRRAVPPEDLEALAERVAGFAGVTVECHPRLVGPSALAWAERLGGRLEVALGLETVHPGALAALNKKVGVDDFDRAAERLRAADVDVRAFVLLGTPGVPEPERLEWTLRSVEHAARAGARLVAINPVRPGNGALERLAAEGRFRPPDLLELETALEQALARVAGLPTVVVADLWEARGFAACAACADARLERLERMNLEGRAPAPVACTACGRCEAER
ncbi:MAG: radical SAM protein, partial [Gemmatimonadetes bacterium]